MKKYLSIYTLLALTCIVLQSCLFSEEEIFDESSANRATADVIKCQEILKDVPNGWKLEYYIGSNYSAGAVTLLMKFDGKQVEMASEAGAEGYKPGTIITSLYQVKSEQSTMLTFDSYNQLIHMFSGPLGLNMNVGGDYEFIIMSATPDKVILQGKKYKNIMEMTPMPKDIPWRIQLEDIINIEKDAFLNTYRMEKGGQVLNYFIRDNGTMSTFSVYSTDYSSAESLPYIYTEKGLKLQSPYNVNGVEVQHFKWDKKFRLFVCTDADATDIVLKEYYPENYPQYEDYIGTYTATVDDYDEGPITQSVTITPKVRGESYTLKSIGGFNFTLQYDKASGKLVLDSQSISSTSSSSYYFACAAGVEGYAHTELSLPSRLRNGLVNVTTNSNPFTFYFADKASQENTSLIIWAYSSDEYSTSGLMGYWSWYNSILMVKENESN